jgi:hypothetical protein
MPRTKGLATARKSQASSRPFNRWKNLPAAIAWRVTTRTANLPRGKI